MDGAYFRIKNNGDKNYWLRVYLARQYLEKELGLIYLGEKSSSDILGEIDCENEKGQSPTPDRCGHVP